MAHMVNRSQEYLRIGILSLATLTLSGIFITPIIAQIAQAFPDEGAASVQLLISVNTLTNLVGAWLVPYLRKIFSLKSIALLATVGIGVFGLLPVVWHNSLWILITFAGCMGVFLGFLATVLPTLISENFDGQERQTIMGQQVAFSSIGAMIFILAVGKLGTISWYIAYSVYAVAFILCVIAAIMIPSERKNEKEVDDKGISTSPPNIFTLKAIVLLLCGFLFVAMMTAYNNNISLIAVENNYGDSGFVGVISMVNQIGGLLAGLLIGVLIRFVKTHMYSIAFICEGAGFLLIALFPTLWGVLAGSFLAGMGLSFYYAQAPFLMSVIQKPWFISAGIAVLTTANGVGGFASPFIVNSLSAVISGGSAAGTLLVSGVILLSIALVLITTNFQANCMKERSR